jgi:uncharacterized protein (TIGR02147 family)
MQPQGRTFNFSKPELFQFNNYRTFLAVHFAFKKRQNSRWSYGAWAKQLGLKNNTSLLKILNGTRDAGPEVTRRLVDYFRFNEKERLYFEDLIRLAKAKDGALQVSIMERLKRHHPLRKFRLLEDSEFSLIADWWHYTLRQFTRLKSFQTDPDWLSRQLIFKVTPKQIARALASMKDLGLLAVDVDGCLKLTGTRLNTTDDVASEALKRFHEGILNIAHQAVRIVKPENREISGITLALDSKTLPQAKEFLRQIQEEFDARFGNSGESDSVYHLELALFPMTELSKKEKDS